ncbi:hypothetical protein TanjilG_00071 [Lupinus angustifolius]|uniref:Protein PHYTOCHROME KINASE SUBSTRATE 4 n=1 Tax=Lupinus angustifolius TaxID=3871 RepID=A0A394D0U0_LUPAN|nr:PREDICTED: protein PHYTOCHROME KINASE SUBSTRATE 4 [Lupinus angustifolius]OIW16699.1 hypothetical protein TanjilG_00071 [Lupinus angustifolius]
MERATMMKTFHDNLTPKSPPQTLRDRDASFSYIQPYHHHHHTIVSDQSRSGLDDSITDELSIFDAHKYFNEVPNNDNNIHKVTTTTTTTITNNNNSRVSPLVTNNSSNMEIMESEINTDTTRYSSASSSVEGYGNMMRNYKAHSFHAATPTASSEASWNSQIGLLSHPEGAIPVSIMNTTNPTNPNNKVITSFSKPIWFLRKKCPCSGKKSVQVKEPKITQIPPPQIPQTQKDHQSLNLKIQQDPDLTLKDNIIPITPNNWVVATTKSQRFHNSQSHQVVTSSNGFTFPVLNLNPNSSNTNTNTNTSIKLHVPNGAILEKELDPVRDSLETFQPPTNNDTMKLATISQSTSPVNNNAMLNEDAESDASSDLFEIETFSTATATQSSYPSAMYRRRDSMEDASSNNGFFFCRRSMDERSTAATECYEPSEASIEWSVTTAAAEEESIGVGVVQSNRGGEKWKKKGSLVSCRSEKAVSVGPKPVMRAMDEQRGATCSSKPPLARSKNNTPSLSLPLGR